MGIKTLKIGGIRRFRHTLKNLPTTWGLRQMACLFGLEPSTLKNLPTTWGLRPNELDDKPKVDVSEKPPHHMGIKT